MPHETRKALESYKSREKFCFQLLSFRVLHSWVAELHGKCGQESDYRRVATVGRGVDVVLEAAACEFGKQSFRLLAPFGRMIVFGARNVHDTFGPEQIQQLIYNNQTITAFNIPSYKPERITASIGPLLALIASRKLKLFAASKFTLDKVLGGVRGAGKPQDRRQSGADSEWDQLDARILRVLRGNSASLLAPLLTRDFFFSCNF